MFNSESSTSTLGTTPCIKIPKEGNGKLDKADLYFQVKIHSAQAVYFPGFWESAKQLVVTSEVKMNCPPFGDDALKSIHQIQPLKRESAQQLGLATTLIALTPATMDRVSIAIEYLLDQRNRLETMADLVNDDAFLSVISLAPGAAAVAKSIAVLSKKIINSFMDDADRRPILKFVGDLELRSGELSDAYYVILGSAYSDHPLPRPLPGPSQLSIDGHELLYNNQAVVDWSYVILDIDTVEYRTKSLGRGDAWHKKLDEAEMHATYIQNDPFAKDADRRQTWSKCQTLLKEADALLRIDPLYLPSEAESIIQEGYQKIRSKIFTKTAGLGAPPGLNPEDRSFLKVASDRDLVAKVAEYSSAQAESEKKLRALGIIQ
jgi:hypothetical protein